MDKKKVLNKKTGIVLLVLILLAIVANAYNRKREDKEKNNTEVTVEESVLDEESGRSVYYIHLEDFSIGDMGEFKEFSRYESGDEKESSQEYHVLDKKSALKIAKLMQEDVEKIGLSILAGEDFSVIQPLITADEPSITKAKSQYEEAVEAYAYKGGNGVILVEFTNVWAEVKDEVTEDNVQEVSLEFDFDYCSTIGRKDTKTDTIESYEIKKSSSLLATFRLENGEWKLLYDKSDFLGTL